MRVGNFSVYVPEGAERDSGHVALKHGVQYTMRIGNHCYDRRCDAQVTIDGKDMGAYRINAGATVVLERPSHDSGRFTFFEAGTVEAVEAGVGKVANPDRGLVTVVFRVERRREREIKTGGILRGRGQSVVGQSVGWVEPASIQPQNCVAGITGLTGQSSQQFWEVPNLDYDHAEETTIHLRLVGDKAVRELTPNAPRSNQVPSAV